MEHTVDPMDEFLVRYNFLTAAAAMPQEELEDQIRQNVWRKDWDNVLQLLTLAEGDISRVITRECLICAIRTASSETVSALLDLFPTGEYAECDTYEVDWSPTGKVFRRSKWEVSVQGTLVMHAVACNRPDVLRLLLDRGHDVNAASAEAAAALLRDSSEYAVSYGDEFVPFRPYTARPENYVHLRRWDAAPNSIPTMSWEGATPLSLAVLLGHTECAHILVERGAWLEEAPSVSSAMYLFWRASDPEYQAARRVVLDAGRTSPYRPVLWALGPACSVEQLRTVLTHCSYHREELARAAHEILCAFPNQQELWQDRHQAAEVLCSKLCHIGHLCPHALCQPKTLGKLLAECCALKELPLEPFLPFLEGKTLDLSHMHRDFGWLAQPEGRKMLTALARHCTLTLERDAIAPGMGIGQLRLLMKHVTFLPPASDRGISGLTLALLIAGDQRLVRHALATGIIWPGESIEELLLCQKHYRTSPTFRMAVLTVPRPTPEPAERAWGQPSFQGFRWFADKIPNRTMPILTEEDWRPWLHPSLKHPFGFYETTALGEKWQVQSVLLAACMDGRQEIVEAWLRHTPPEELLNINPLICPARNIHLVVTPLCAAALAGHRPIVQLLLAHGAPAEEHLWGYPSVWGEFRQDGSRRVRLPFPPVLAATLGGFPDIADLLIAHGAVPCRDPRDLPPE